MPVKQLIHVVCEGPRCKTGPNESTFHIAWEPEIAKNDPNAVPDAAWRLVTLAFFSGETHVFCCVRCQHDWQLEHKEIQRSPRELAALQQAAQKKQAEEIATEKEEKSNLIEFPASRPEGVPEGVPGNSLGGTTDDLA